MLIYWLMFLVPAGMSLLTGTRSPLAIDRRVAGFGVMFVVYAVIVGFRYHLGADADAYDDMANEIGSLDLMGALRFGDPTYSLVSWISEQLDWQVYGATVSCALILMAGVLRYARAQADPWLVVTVAVPYVIIVVGIGYIRQAAALGLILIGMVQYQRGQTARFFGWVAAAATFHSTAVGVIPFAALEIVKRRPLVIVPASAVAVLLYYLLLANKLDTFNDTYIVNKIGMDSGGALVRQVMNTVPAIAFFMLRKRIWLMPQVRLFWLAIAGAACLLLALLAVPGMQSTLIDRVGLYLSPIQLFVAGNIATWTAVKPNQQRLIKVIVIVFYALSLFVWLVYATHATYWLPYRFMPFVMWLD